MKKQSLLTLSIVFFYFSAMAQDYSLYQKSIFKNSAGQEMNYRILYPENYKASIKYPVLLFLHGSGERGNDNENQLFHGADLFLNQANREKFPAIVIFPQCPSGKSWASLNITNESGKKTYKRSDDKVPGEMAGLLNEFLIHLRKNTKIDRKRIYIMGLSMGGFGTFEMLYLFPDVFAAAVPICGGHNTDLAKAYAKVPVWIFHGAKDPVVPTDFSREIYARLNELGAEVKYTEFPEAGHDSWTSAFATPELLPWIFSHRKK